LRGRGSAAAVEALASLEKALALNPEFAPAKVYKAMALGQMGDQAQAARLLREVLASQPDHVEANRELRALKDRSKKDEGKGLLGKLFKR
ncbi:MAG: tetratricopeptide repeat protein, partial [Myxococcales bacterium]